MRLSLRSTKALRLSISQHGLPEDIDDSEVWVPMEDSEPSRESKFTLSHTAAYSDTGSNDFAIIFEFSTVLPEYSLEIDLEYIAEFETDKPVDDDFKKSNFPTVNAPAIAFPYLRAFISNVLLQSGYKPLILPSINFVARAKSEE